MYRNSANIKQIVGFLVTKALQVDTQITEKWIRMQSNTSKKENKQNIMCIVYFS